MLALAGVAGLLLVGLISLVMVLGALGGGDEEREAASAEATPEATPTPTATPSPTPIPQCQVPSFIGDANNNNALRTKWQNAGFVQNNLDRVGGNWDFVQSQTLVAGSMQTCSTAQIRVGP